MKYLIYGLKNTKGPTYTLVLLYNTVFSKSLNSTLTLLFSVNSADHKLFY